MTLYFKHVKNRGFTLVEVMAAVVVLAIGISSILVLIGRSTRSVNTARHATVQTCLARLAMVEIENKYWQKEADEVDTGGDFGRDFPNYRYEVEITEDIDEKIPSLHRVDLVVYNERVGLTPYRLTTYLIDFSR